MTPGIDVTVLCADTEAILADWVETLSVHRKTVAYDFAGEATETWAEVDSFEGDWQPTRGELVYDEAGVLIESDALIIGPCGVDVEPSDRVVQDDGSYMKVEYVAVHEGHMTIYLKEAERGSISTRKTPTDAQNKTALANDTDVILADWHETVTINQRTVVYGTDGMAVSAFVKQGTIVGDWQPLSGTDPREESGERAHRVAQFISRPDVDVEEDDQLVRQDGAVYYVHHVRWHEDHATILLKRTQGQST